MTRSRIFVFVLLIFVLAVSSSVYAQTTEFVYQGQLQNSAAPANGSFDFEFLLYDALSGGTQVGVTLTQSGVAVANGIFSVKLDFGSNYPGSLRFLEVHVRQAGGGSFTPLMPRQKIEATPYSVKSIAATAATTAGNVTGIVAVANGGTGSATQNFVDLTTNQSVGGTKTFTNPIGGDGSLLTNINGGNITNNTINSSALASDTFPNNQNLSRLGQRRWDLLGQRVTVGSNPRYLAFDGANIWVTNAGASNVTKVRSSDGAVLGTFAVGTAPFGIVFDGANIWVVNQGSNTVTRLRSSDGACVGTCTFAVGMTPVGIAFDGSNVWVANFASNSVTKLRASDGAVQGTFTVGTNPFTVEFDGVNIWVVNNGTNNVTKLFASNGAVLGTFAVGSSPAGIVFDGSNIWVASAANNSTSVTKLRAQDGACAGVVGPPTAACTFTVGSQPAALAFDGANIWVSLFASHSVAKVRASDGVILATFDFGTNPDGVAFDGANIWVANLGDNNVQKIPVFP